MRSEPESQLLMERPQTLGTAEQTAGAGIKTILLHVHDDESVMDRLRLVLTLARACGAHVHCLNVTPIQTYTVVDNFGATYINQEIVDALERQAAKLQQRIEKQLRIADLSWDYEETTDAVLPKLVQCAAFADLVITGREPKQRDFGGSGITLIGDLLAQLRTPLLVTGDRLLEWGSDSPAVIAWNGSYEAANAVRNAIPLLKMARETRIVEFNEKKERQVPSTDLLEYLSRHGVRAELDARETREPIDEALVRFAEELDAGIIVMGGYGHSRAGEFLFGGITRALIKNCPVALVMAH
jgi:nucleotide-binding universal stress UspA family protein